MPPGCPCTPHMPVCAQVRQGIQAARKPPGYTGGGNARCISIPLAVDLGGTRSAEWQ
jgi:hypothetical protein